MRKEFKRISKNFLKAHPKIVAPKLLGKFLIRKIGKEKIIAKIIETEAYGGKEDKACHIGRFGRTKRTELLFGDVGNAYVYSVHINMHCLNVVAHRKNEAGGVLIRAIEIIKGMEIVQRNLNYKNLSIIDNIISGPAKVCKALKIDKSLNSENLTISKKIYLTYGERVSKKNIIKTPRINIPYAKISKNWKWRFLIEKSF